VLLDKITSINNDSKNVLHLKTSIYDTHSLYKIKLMERNLEEYINWQIVNFCNIIKVLNFVWLAIGNRITKPTILYFFR